MAKQELHDVVIQVDGKQVHQSSLSLEDVATFLGEHCPQHTEAALERMERRARVNKEILSDPDKIALFTFLCQARAKTDALLNTDLEGLSSDQQFERVSEYHKYTDLGSAILYEHRDFGGAAKFVTVPWPNFSWKPYKFNDKASSVKGWGLNIFFRGSWWRTEGQNPLWVIGAPYIEFPDLERFGFNEIISSYLP